MDNNTINKGSIDKFLREMMRKEKNALNIISMYCDVLSSKDEKLIIEYVQEDGKVESFEIPSFSYIIASIRRIEKNFENLASIGLMQTSLLFPDGSRRVILSQNVPTEPSPVSFSLGNNSTFNSKDVDVISQFVTPRTYISFDIKNFSDISTKKCIINKIILSFDTLNKRNYAENNLYNRNFTYEEIIERLNSNMIKYEENEIELSVEPRYIIKSGKFSVINITKEEVKKISNGIETKSYKLFYILDKLTYKNNVNKSDVNLKIGDSLLISNKTGDKNTVYQIDTIDYSKNKVSMIRLEGLDQIKIGVDKLIISPDFQENIIVNLPIHSGEVFIPFFKPIQDSHQIINTSWGSSSIIIANNLSLISDQTIKFADYYKENVDDLRSGLQNIKENVSSPISEVIVPSSPVLNHDNFSVKMINSHKISSMESLTKEKYAEKEKIKTAITATDESINNLKEKLSQTADSREKEKLTTEINGKYKSRKNLVSNFASLISNITAIIKDSNSFTPKYRIRGFFDIPSGKYVDPENKLGLQEIIKFECEYRYLRQNSTENSAETMSYKDSSGNEIKASYSNWNKCQNLVQRTKKYNSTIKKVEWEREDLLNPEIINVNQIDIPISENESVEIRVRSISEVGYPTVLTFSNWSESVIVEYPKELTSTSNSILSEIGNDQFLTTIEQELTSLGVYDHLSDSFVSGDKLYHHSAKNVSTDYYTQENKQMSVAQVIADIKQQIEKVADQYSISSSQLEVTIIDESGNVIANVNNNDNITIFAGYYKDLVKGENSKGEIITKMYYLNIKNPKATNVELLSYVPGLYENRLPHGDNYTDYVNNKYEYDSYRKYFDTPISFRGIVQNDEYMNHRKDNSNPFIELPTFGSSQVKGQFVYSRYNDISLSNSLYMDATEVGGNNGYNTLITTGGNAESFVFKNYANNVPTGNGNLTDFCCHINHPDVQNKILANSLLYDQTTYMPKATYTEINNIKHAPFIIFGHSKLSSIESGSNENYYKQLSYVNYIKSEASASITNFPRKIGFSQNDKYLIGKNTCGSYLFLAPQLTKSLYTGSNIYNKGYVLSNTEVRIPIIFQVRMQDYFGEGDSGVGRIGGDETKTNLFYSKKIGIDFLPKNQDLFSFDISVEMQYQKSV